MSAVPRISPAVTIDGPATTNTIDNAGAMPDQRDRTSDTIGD